MAKARYVAVIEHAGDGSHGVWFPDFNGCVSSGETFQAALANAREALELHLEGMVEDGEPLPNPIHPLMLQDVDFSHNLPVVIEVDVPAAALTKAVRLNITLPEALLSRIDQVSNGNRSGWLAQAAREKLGVAPDDRANRLAEAQGRIKTRAR